MADVDTEVQPSDSTPHAQEDAAPTTSTSTPKVRRLSRDQRRDILLMRRLGHSYEKISTFLGVSQRAVQYTCQKQRASPEHKNSGRTSKLSKEDVDRLVQRVTSYGQNKPLTYAQLSSELYPGRDIGVETLKHALRKAGIDRRGHPSRPLTQVDQRGDAVEARPPTQPPERQSPDELLDPALAKPAG